MTPKEKKQAQSLIDEFGLETFLLEHATDVFYKDENARTLVENYKSVRSEITAYLAANKVKIS